MPVRRPHPTDHQPPHRVSTAAAPLALATLAVGAGLLVGAPSARADVGDLFDALFDPAGFGALTDTANWDGLNFSPAGDDVTHALSAAAAPALAPGEVPLRVEGAGSGYPIADISFGGQDAVSVVVDTGTHGLVIPIWDLPFEDIMKELTHFSFDDITVAKFPFAFSVGLAMPTSIDLGNGVAADDVTVTATLFSFPFSPTDAMALSGIPVHGILGVGPNAGGPDDTPLVTESLPGDLGKGVLIDEPGGRLIFGAQPEYLDGYSPGATLNGAPFPGGSPYLGNPDGSGALQVQIGDGPLQKIPVVFDTGSTDGWIPGLNFGADDSQFGNVPGGTLVTVFAPDGTPLYSHATPGDDDGGMIIMPKWLLDVFGLRGYMNAGNAAFADSPVYISNAGDGSMTFYTPTPR